MKFKTKILLLFSSVGILITIIFSIYTKRYLDDVAEARYLQRYETSLTLVGDLFLQLEGVSSAVGQNAARALLEIVKSEGLPADSKLEKIAKELNVSNIFATDRHGKFIRSTNGPISDYKNTLFDYCKSYKSLVYGNAKFFETPLIPSSDEKTAGPFKYIMIPNHDRSGVLEVSIHIDFIEKLIRNVLREDVSYLTLEIMTPTNERLGSISREKESELVPSIAMTKKITLESMSQCCECVVKGITSANSEQYWYTLNAKISTVPLLSEKVGITKKIAVAGFFGLAISILVGFILSNSLSRGVADLTAGLEAIDGDDSKRISASGKDEFSFIATKVNSLLLAIEKKNQIISKNEADRVTVQLAKQVAHDLRSPLTALQVIADTSDADSELLRMSVRRIKEISADLFGLAAGKKQIARESVDIVNLIKEIVFEKSRLPGYSFLETEIKCDSDKVFSLVNSAAIRRAVSNIFDNAAEAMEKKGTIRIELTTSKKCLDLKIVDSGIGIPEEHIGRIFERGYSFNKSGGSGLGLSQAKAAVEESGGEIKIESSAAGTVVGISLPISDSLGEV